LSEKVNIITRQVGGRAFRREVDRREKKRERISSIGAHLDRKEKE